MDLFCQVTFIFPASSIQTPFRVSETEATTRHLKEAAKSIRSSNKALVQRRSRGGEDDDDGGDGGRSSRKRTERKLGREAEMGKCDRGKPIFSKQELQRNYQPMSDRVFGRTMLKCLRHQVVRGTSETLNKSFKVWMNWGRKSTRGCPHLILYNMYVGFDPPASTLFYPACKAHVIITTVCAEMLCEILQK